MGHGGSRYKEAKSACSVRSYKTFDAIYTAVLVSLTRPLSPGRLSIRYYKHPLQTSTNAFNGLVACYIGPYTLHEAVYSVEITAMVFVAGLPLTFPPTVQLVSAKGRKCMLPHLKLVALQLHFIQSTFLTSP